MSQESGRSQTQGSFENESVLCSLGTPVAASTLARPRQVNFEGPPSIFVEQVPFGSFLDRSSLENFGDSSSLSGLPSLQQIDLSGISLSPDDHSQSVEHVSRDRDSYLTETSSLGLIPEAAMEGLSIGLLQVDDPIVNAKDEDNVSERTITPVAWHDHCPRISDDGVSIVLESSPEEKSFRKEFRESLEGDHGGLGIRVAATGIESDHSEIDTDDELEAARKEIAKQKREHYLSKNDHGQIEAEDSRPGLEGGSSDDDNDDISSVDSLERDIKPLSYRQSAEGDVSVSPVPGDGGGGGDGSSGGGSTDVSDSEDDTAGFVPGSDNRQNTMDVLRRLGLAGNAEDILMPPVPGKEDDGPVVPSRMRPAGGDDPAHFQVRFTSPSKSSSHSSHFRSSNDSEFSHTADQDVNQQNVDVTLSRFLKPSSNTYGNETVDEPTSPPWSPDASSFYMSDIFAIQDRDVARDSAMDDTLQGETDLDETLTRDDIRQGEGDDQSPAKLFTGRSSLGGFGLGKGDFSYSQDISFGDGEFSRLEPASMSPQSNENRSIRPTPVNRSRQEERAEVQGAESGEEDLDSAIAASQLRNAPAGDDNDQHTMASQSFKVEDGEIVTDLAFRSPFPSVQKNGYMGDFNDTENFNVQSDEDFLSSDQAMAKLAADEQNFEQESVFVKEQHAEPANSTTLDGVWGVHDGALVQFNKITGQEDFCRISIGAFLGSRSEAVGSLSQTDSRQRPSFGDGTIVTPPHANGPFALISTTSQPDEQNHNLDGSFVERKDGVGETEMGGPAVPKPAPLKHRVNNGSQTKETRTPPAGNGTEVDDQIKLLETSIAKADASVNISSIASAIANAASSSRPEDLAELIKQLSQKPIHKKHAAKQTESSNTESEKQKTRNGDPLKTSDKVGPKTFSSNQMYGHTSCDPAQPMKSDRESHEKLFKPIGSDDNRSKIVNVNIKESGTRGGSKQYISGQGGISPKKLYHSLQALNQSSKKSYHSYSPPSLQNEDFLHSKSQSLPELVDQQPPQKGTSREFTSPPQRFLIGGSRESMERAKREHLQKYLNDSDPRRLPLHATDNGDYFKQSKPENDSSSAREHVSENSNRKNYSPSSRGNLVESYKSDTKRTIQIGNGDSAMPTKSSVRGSSRSASDRKSDGGSTSDDLSAADFSKAISSALGVVKKGGRETPSLVTSNLPDDEKRKSPGKFRTSSDSITKTNRSIDVGKSQQKSPNRISVGKSPTRSPGRSSGYSSILEQKAAIAQTLNTPISEGDSPEQANRASFMGKGSTPDFNEQSVLDTSTPKKLLFSQKSADESPPFARSSKAVTVKHIKEAPSDLPDPRENSQAPVVASFKLFNIAASSSSTPTLLTSQSLLNTTVANQYLSSRPTTTCRSTQAREPSTTPAPSSVGVNIPPNSTQSAASMNIPGTSVPQYMSAVAISWPSSVYRPFGLDVAGQPALSSGQAMNSELSSVYTGLAPRVASTVISSGVGRVPMPPNIGMVDLASGMVIPGELRFVGVCCVGIAAQTTLPIHNTTDRWIKCTMSLVTVLANGAEVDPDKPSPFAVKNSAIIPPGKTEDTNILFVPHHPGIFVAQLQVLSNLVVAENTAIRTPEPCVSIVTMHAIAEKANIHVEADDNQTLNFGDVVHGSCRSKALKVYNRGRSTVPVRFIISTSSVAWHCFSFGKIDNRIESTSPSSRTLTPRGSSILSLTLPGYTDNKSEVEPMLIWVDFKAPQRNLDHVTVLGKAEDITARIDLELDTPDSANNIASRVLKATLGCARLHIPKELLNKPLVLSAPVSKTSTQFLPLKNAGNLPVTVELKVTKSTEFFSVIPASLTLKPDEVTDIVLKFTPVDAPVVIESVLIMTIQPDGPDFEVQLKGKGTVPEKVSVGSDTSSVPSHHSKQDTSMLLCNKQFVAWGGVPIGRALQQKVILRNNSKTDIMKLKVFIRAEHSDFQLQSSFGHQDNLSDNRDVILKPSEDFSLHILFAPTSITCRQAKLIMKPHTGGSKYVLPLSGYGGISNLVIKEFETMGSTYVSNIGTLTTNEPKVTQIKIHNTGPRSAFVKAISFADLSTKTKLAKGCVVVDPSEFIISEKGSRMVTVIVNTSDRETTLCYSQSKVVAAVGFFYGDEITRQQYRRESKKSSRKPVTLSDNNPLKGINFDVPYVGEDYVYEVYDMPAQPNDSQLFFSCMSRLMVALVGSPPSDKLFGHLDIDATSVSVLPGLMDETKMQEDTGHRPSLVHVSHTPPTQISKCDNSTALSTGPLKSCMDNGIDCEEKGTLTHWEVIPEFVILSATSNLQAPISRARIQLINYTERRLSFEISWPGHSLTITPQNGVIEARSQLLVYVSPNSSLLSKGIQLPWRGAVYVSCDGVTKEVRVQIRPDLAMDTSIYPTSRQDLLSLPSMSATPGVTMIPTKSSSTPAIRVLGKRIEFPITRIGESTETSLEFQNVSDDVMRWSLSSIAPAYVKQDKKEVYRATYTAFRFVKQLGVIAPGQSVKIPVTFIPRDIGSYSQFWELEANSKENVAVNVQQIKIELAGNGVKAASASTKTHRRGPVATGVVVQKEPMSSTTSRVGDSGYDSKSRLSIKSKISDTTTDSTAYLGVILPKQTLSFPITAVGKVCKLKLPIKNEGSIPHTVTFVNPRPPFHVNHSHYLVKPRHYVNLPVIFKPEHPGKYESMLVIATDVEHSLVAKLYGESV